MNLTRLPQEAEQPNTCLVQENVLFSPSMIWKQFDRFVLGYAGAFFLLAGVICFFAYNWHMLPPFAKFGLIAAAMLISAAFPLFRCASPTGGKLGLLSCGIFGGILMAVYGQVYQTGADSWTLFRSWAIFLIPLALAGRQTGLWFLLWLVSSLSGILYCREYAALHDSTIRDNLLFYQCLAQAAWLISWETAAHFLSGPRFAFLAPRWLPRTIGVCLLSFLTCFLTIHIGNIWRPPYIYHICLYLALTGGIIFYYRKQRTDLFMTAAGLFSLSVLLLAWLAHILWHKNESLLFFCLAACLIVYAALSGKYLVACHKKWRVSHGKTEKSLCTESIAMPSGKQVLSAFFSLSCLRLLLREISPSASSAKENKEEEKGVLPWQARLLMGACAWITIPCLTGLILSLFASLERKEYILLFLLLLAAGLALTYRSGIFLRQAALCLCLTGACAAAILAGMETGSKEWSLLPAIIILAASIFPAKNHTYRFLALVLATLCFLLQADIFLNMAYRRFPCGKSLQDNLFCWLITAIYSLLYIACGIKLASFWHHATCNQQWKWRQHPLAAALFAIPLLLGVLSILFSTFIPPSFLRQIGLSGIFTHMAGLGAVAGLGYLVFQTTKKPEKNWQTRLAVCLPCLLLAVAAWYMPWLGIGLLLFAFARQAKSLVLSGIAILFIAVCTPLEYYALSTTLLMKSFSLSGIGLLLLACAAALHSHIARLQEKQPSPAVCLSGISPEHSQVHQVIVSTFSSRFRILPFAWIGIFLLFFVFSVHQKEKLLENGQRVILAMRPLDPRSLMQGDYMTVSLDIENDIRRKRQAQPEKDQFLHENEGTVIVTPDKNGIFHFARFDNGETLKEQEVRLTYRIKRWGIQIGPGSFFFQEGQGKLFGKARFVELRAGKDGEVLFTHLLDENRQRIRADS